MSSLKTDNLNLHKWAGADKVRVEEFNENFDALDAAVSNVVTSDVLNNRIDAASASFTAALNLKAAQSQVDAMAAQLNALMQHDILLRLTVVNGILHVDGVPVSAGSGGSAPVSAFGLIGKWFTESVDGLTSYSTHYPGATIQTTVTGTTSVTANFRFTGEPWIEAPVVAVRINGGAWTRHTMADNLQIASGLNAGASNKIEVVFDGWNQNENLWGDQRKFTFRGFTVAAGGTAVYSNNRRNILVVGDSITVGTKAVANGNAAAQSSAVLSYSQYLADALDVNLYRSAYPGKKVIEPFTRENVGLVTNGRAVDNYNIHTVIVAMGTNDYQAETDEFKNAYQQLIDAIRVTYPTQPIAVVGLFESDATIRRNDELEAIAGANAGVYHISTAALTGVTYTDGLHPDAAGARTISNFLRDALIAADWENGGGASGPSIPGGNLWEVGGMSPAYNPLPSGFATRIDLPGSYAGATLKISFTASSAKASSLSIYTEYRADFDYPVTLTPVATAYERQFTVSYSGEGSYLYIVRGDHAEHDDINISNIMVEAI